MDNRKYCLVQNGKIVKYNQSRKDFGVGVNSDEATCSDKGYYLVIDNVPNYNTATQRIGGNTYNIDEATKTVTKTYNIVDIPLDELQAKKINEATQLVDGLIQAEIDVYNEANGVAFKDIDSLAKYALVTTYAHNAFAVSMVNWVASLWEAARTSTATTTEDFIAGLPTRV